MNWLQKLKLRKQIKKHIDRPLDIREILSRETDANVVVDAYEFFMRQCHWCIDGRFSPCVNTLLLCVLYDGEIANGGISQFLLECHGDKAHATADALHEIGAWEAEALLRKSFSLFSGGIVPADENTRNQMLAENSQSDGVLESLDMQAYNADILDFCYQYLMANKKHFLEFS